MAATVILVSCATSSLHPPAPVSRSAAPPESAPASPPSPAIVPAIVATKIERSPEQLWSLLQQAEGSTYAVLIRHATAPGTGDPPNFQLEDCSTQRNLSQAGRQQAIQLGEAFRSRDWVHRGYASYPYNKLMAPSALFAPAQEEQNVRMIHLSRDDDPRNLEARKGITRMQQLVAIRSQLQLAQAALDQAITLAEAAIEPYWADGTEAET